MVLTKGNLLGMYLLVMRGHNSCMDVQTHRKARLRELIQARFGGVIARFAEAIDRNESYVSRMLYPSDKSGSKPIADKIMLVMEEALNLERAWLDKPMGYDLGEEGAPASGVSELAAVIHRLTSSGKMNNSELQTMIAMLKAREGSE